MSTKTKIVAIAFSIYILNDFVLADCRSSEWYLGFDYFFRFAVLLLIAVAIFGGKITLHELRLIPVDKKVLLMESAKLILLGYLIAEFLEPIFPLKGFVNFPPYATLSLRIFDLSFGLMLVALSEELIFRGMLLYILSSNRVLISSVAFGMIHWGMGLGSVVSTALIGALFAHTTLKTNSLYPVLIAHFFINFLLFV